MLSRNRKNGGGGGGGGGVGLLSAWVLRLTRPKMVGVLPGIIW